MASSGTVTLITKSVDWCGHDYPGPFCRGHTTLTNTIGWSVNDNADISFSLISTTVSPTTNWGICTANNPYYIELVPQVSYNNGASWVNLDVKRHLVTEMCSSSSRTYTVAMSRTLIEGLGSYHLSGNCQLRFLYYMTVAPAPSSDYPYAFPNESYSEVTQVPVVIVMDYRPGEDLVGGTWKSHNRDGGHADIRRNNSWVEMKTQDGTGDPPQIRRNGSWVNQAKIGAE